MLRLRFPPLPLWTGRDDGFGPERIHQHVQAIELDKLPFATAKQFAFVGFSSDEGVSRNKGRIGAAQGPEELRKSLSNLSWNAQKPHCVDIGDVICTNNDLEGAQKELGEIVSILIQKKYTPIVLGGGHETAWGHFQGIAPHSKKTLIINFDAHYDMRPLIDGKFGSSGTSFLQIAEFSKSARRNFTYVCIGMQPSANTVSLQKTADQWQVESITAEALHRRGLTIAETLIDRQLITHDHVYLSVCMDVFGQAYAPGVSAPQALGLSPWLVIPLLRKIAASKKLISADFVELSPPHDRDSQTAKLGASLIWELMSI